MVFISWNCHNSACNSGKSLRHGNRFTVAWVILSSDHLIFQLKSWWGSCTNPKTCSKIPLQLSYWWAVPQTPMMTIPCGSFLSRTPFELRFGLRRNPCWHNSIWSRLAAYQRNNAYRFCTNNKIYQKLGTSGWWYQTYTSSEPIISWQSVAAEEFKVIFSLASLQNCSDNCVPMADCLWTAKSNS